MVEWIPGLLRPSFVHLHHPFTWSEPLLALQRLTRARFYLMQVMPISTLGDSNLNSLAYGLRSKARKVLALVLLLEFFLIVQRKIDILGE